MPKRNLNKPSYFTIIELLVVISVVALLASLLQPSLSTMFEKARINECSSNLRAHSIGVQLYLEDHAYYPKSHEWLRGNYHWKPEDAIQKGLNWDYMQSLDKHICPTFRMINDQLPDRRKVTAFSYGFNWQAISPSKHNNYNDIKYPSGLALMTEENPFIINGLYRFSFNNATIVVGWRYTKPYIDGIATFHDAGNLSNPKPENGLSNILFVDGHVSLGAMENIESIMKDEPY